MSGEPLRGPCLIFFLEGGVVKIFFGGRGVKEGVGAMCFLDLEWSFEQALRATHPSVCYRSNSHSGNNNHHHHLATMINDLIINDNN